MLYLFYEQFDINILQYITVRSGIAFFIALLLTLYLMPKFIKWASASSKVQPINEYAPESHKEKGKTPTMGGVVFIFSTLVASFITVQYYCPYSMGAIATLTLFALIGFSDDFSKIRQNNNLAGLSARVKFIFQILSALAISLYLYFYADFNTELYVPFLKTPLFDMGIFSIPFWTIVIVGASNAVNLTDGLDGLATVPSIFALATLGVIVYITGNAVISNYLLMPNFQIGELAIIASTLIGALIGFLWHNCHPAEIFMGDSGSLTLGAFIAYMGIAGKSEILLLLIGFVFVLETVSVILQVGSYKIRNKRVFLMAPIHHHFEMKKWAENKIIVRFWIIAMLSNLIALITLKIR